MSDPTDPTDASPTPPVEPARPRRSRKRRALIAVGVAFAVLLAGTVGFGVYAYNHLSANIATIDDTQDQTDRPTPIQPSVAAALPPLNILLIGSDTRAGDNGFVGGDSGVGLSDTTMLLHIAADRESALAVSIPRDSMVEMPSCKTTNGGTSIAGLRQFNEAYSLGGASCVRRTVEQLTDIRIDHYVVVDFHGFRDMVKALGGVKVYLPEAVNDTVGNITLPAGCVTLNGDQALDYVRLRHIGNGSDPERLARQQAFLSSVLQKVTSKGTLTNPVKLYSFLDAATASLSTDTGAQQRREARRPCPGHPRRRSRPDPVHDDPHRDLPARPQPPAVDVAGRRRVEGHPQRQAAARLRAQAVREPHARRRRASRW